MNVEFGAEALQSQKRNINGIAVAVHSLRLLVKQSIPPPSPANIGRHIYLHPPLSSLFFLITMIEIFWNLFRRRQCLPRIGRWPTASLVGSCLPGNCVYFQTYLLQCKHVHCTVNMCNKGKLAPLPHIHSGTPTLKFPPPSILQLLLTQRQIMLIWNSYFDDLTSTWSKARGLAQHGGPPGWLEESDAKILTSHWWNFKLHVCNTEVNQPFCSEEREKSIGTKWRKAQRR